MRKIYSTFINYILVLTFLPTLSLPKRKFFSNSSSVTTPSSRMVRELMPDSKIFFAISEPNDLIFIKSTLAALSLELI